MSSFLLIKTGLTFYLIAASCFFGVKVFAQRDTIYISSDYEIVSNQSLSEWKRVIQFKNGDGTFKVIDFDRNGKVRFNGSVFYVNASDSYFENSYTFYHDNGNHYIIGKSDYKKGYYQGYQKFFYRNGSLCLVQEIVNEEELVISALDSLGNSTITNGSGYASFEVDYERLRWTGKITSNRFDSVWTAIDIQSGIVKHLETYNKGRFIEGKTISTNGIINYTRLDTVIPDDKVEAFLKRIKKEITAAGIKESKLKNVDIVCIIKFGRPTKLVQFLKDLDEKPIDLSKVNIPNVTFDILKRGMPVESYNLFVN